MPSGTPELIACSFTEPPPQVDWIVQFAATVCVSGYVHRVGRTTRGLGAGELGGWRGGRYKGRRI